MAVGAGAAERGNITDGHGNMNKLSSVMRRRLWVISSFSHDRNFSLHLCFIFKLLNWRSCLQPVGLRALSTLFDLFLSESSINSAAIKSTGAISLYKRYQTVKFHAFHDHF